jgi:hypothetical protein
MTTKIRTILLVGYFFFGLLTGLQAQTLKLDSLTDKYIMRDVITVDTALTREQIFTIAKEWIVRNLKSSDNNIQLDDKDYKQITSTGVIKTSDMPIAICSIGNCMIDFKLTINIKEGKIRYTIENIVHYGTNTCSNPPERMTTPLEKWNLKVKLGKNVFADIQAKLTALTKDLAISFSQKRQDEKDDW